MAKSKIIYGVDLKSGQVCISNCQKEIENGPDFKWDLKSASLSI